jgi:hypothetical protein
MIDSGETVPTPYLRRAKTLRQGYMAALFQWSPDRETTRVAFDPSERGAQLTASGRGFAASFAFERGNLTCLSLTVS